MTALGELPDQDDRAHDQLSGPPARRESEADTTLDGAPDSAADRQSDDQFELFGGAPEGDNPRLPKAANLSFGGRDAADASASKRDAPRAGAPDDDEMRRLEASVRWLQDEGYRHLPRAANLPAVADLRVDASPRADAETGAQFNPDEPANASAAPYPRDPRRTLPPRSARRRPTGGLRNLLIASVIAAPPAYFIAKWHWIPGFDTVELAVGALEARALELLPAPRPARSQSQMARVPQRLAIAAIPDQNADEVVVEKAVDAHIAAIEPQARAAEATDQAPLAVAAPPETPRQAPPGGNSPADTPHAGAPPTSAPRSPEPKLSEPKLDAREIAVLLQRGRDFFESGDLAGARLLFRRAANAGDAAAALAMGATYDPAVLANRLVRGVGADYEQARVWYERARELGSPEGPRRLEMLAHR